MEQVSRFVLYNTVVLVVLEQKNQTNPSFSSYVTYVTVGSPVTSKKICSDHGTQEMACCQC